MKVDARHLVNVEIFFRVLGAHLLSVPLGVVCGCLFAGKAQRRGLVQEVGEHLVDLDHGDVVFLGDVEVFFGAGGGLLLGLAFRFGVAFVHLGDVVLESLLRAWSRILLIFLRILLLILLFRRFLHFSNNKNLLLLLLGRNALELGL